MMAAWIHLERLIPSIRQTRWDDATWPSARLNCYAPCSCDTWWCTSNGGIEFTPEVAPLFW